MTEPERDLLEARVAAFSRVIDAHVEANSLSASEVLLALAVCSASMILSAYVMGATTQAETLALLADFKARLTVTLLAGLERIGPQSETKH
jgi:hypothetical protein